MGPRNSGRQMRDRDAAHLVVASTASTAEDCIYHCDGTKRREGEGELGWCCSCGFDLPEEQLVALLETTRAGHEAVPDLMAEFFGDLLERCGVEIENRVEASLA